MMQNAASSHDTANHDSARSPLNHVETNSSQPHLDTPTVPDGNADDTLNGRLAGAASLNGDAASASSIPAAKKRKFAELSERSRSTSRAASPPWKAFAAEGPTQFSLEGKRRSGRVNSVPLELQPPSDKRQTRAKHGAVVQCKHERKEGKATVIQHVSKPVVSVVKTERTSSMSKQSNGIVTIQTPTRTASQRTTRKSESLANGHVQEAQEDGDGQEDQEDKKPKVELPTQEKKRVGRPSNASKQAEAASPNHVKRSPDVKRLAAISVPSQPSPRLRLKIPRLVIAPRHPDHIPKISRFSSLVEALSHYDQVEKEQGPGDKEMNALDELERRQVEKAKETPEQVAWKEARSRIRVLEASRPGGILSREKSSLYLPDDQAAPPSQYTHSDHLWSHGAYFKLLLSRERHRHMDLAKKTAHACLAKWKEKQPQTEEEKLKEEDDFFRLIYKQTVRDVQRKWDLVTGEIEKRRFQQWMEDQEMTRDLNMQRMLENTTRMLEQRRLGVEVDSLAFDGSDEDGQDGSGDDDQDSDGSRSGEEHSVNDDVGSNDDDDNMSSSESEKDEDSLAGDDDDAHLSPEALRAKYSGLKSIDAPGVDSAEDAMDVDDDPGANDEEVPDAEGEDMSHVVLDEVDEALLDDDDDDSTDMSDDDSEEDEDDESADGSEGSADEEEDGLLGFLGGSERRAVQHSTHEEDVNMEDEPVEQSEVASKPTELATPPTEQFDSDPISPGGNYLSVTSHEGDHSTQPTPQDYTTAEPTDVDSTTSIDPEDAVKEPQAHAGRSITTPIPSLLRGTLREYQHFGLDWLAKLYANQTNGILADEMGLGKTIQTIALLAHLAEEHQVWGPHLIVVPTSVILNWEMEFKKFLPGFKILSYYGTQEERAIKRKGWANPDNYNVVITSYQLILKDLASIRVPEWHYMILDEAHNIKNFQSQRYQAMIRLKTHARLLLTGTPLQNSIQELWSLLTFLTAGQDGQGMGDLEEFTQWFRRPVDEIFVDGRNKLGVEAQAIVNKLHHSLRPYILRRMKSQVEKQLPGKYEHTLFCRLSKRQRQLYDGFLGRADTKEKLSSGNPISVSQALISLRKVCNHQDLFEERPIVTSFTMRKPFSKMPRSVAADFEIKELLLRKYLLEDEDNESASLVHRNFDLLGRERQSRYHIKRSCQLRATHIFQHVLKRQLQEYGNVAPLDGSSVRQALSYNTSVAESTRLDNLKRYTRLTDSRTNAVPVYGCDLIERCRLYRSDRTRMAFVDLARRQSMEQCWRFDEQAVLSNMVTTVTDRGAEFNLAIQKFGFVTPHAVAHDLLPYTMPKDTMTAIQSISKSKEPDPFHEARVRLSIAFPDKRLLQYDCGKLQQLALLLRQLTSRGSRALIFTQMTSVLDILEQFLNIHGYRYLRLDGSTKIEQRQDMMERFNRDTRLDVFILSSRSGGVGMNLTGADSVIFYDLDWNPQMDKQCQDRAHRIGQTRDVHIYKLVSEHTIEVNILKKSNQKRMLDEVVIQEGEFTTDYFDRPAEDLDDNVGGDDFAGAAVDRVFGGRGDVTRVLEAAEDVVDVEAARNQAKDLHLDDADFGNDNKQSSSAAATRLATPAINTAAGQGVGQPVVAADGTEISTTLDAAQSGLVDPLLDPVTSEDQMRHVDEYMLGFVEMMFKGVPFVPPVDKSKRGRLDKNGRDRSHRPRPR